MTTPAIRPPLGVAADEDPGLFEGGAHWGDAVGVSPVVTVCVGVAVGVRPVVTVWDGVAVGVEGGVGDGERE